VDLADGVDQVVEANRAGPVGGIVGHASILP
jgi:hypothetical protein